MVQANLDLILYNHIGLIDFICVCVCVCVQTPHIHMPTDIHNREEIKCVKIRILSTTETVLHIVYV